MPSMTGRATGVSVANAFVILSRDEWRDSFAIAHNEEGKLFAFEKFFEDDVASGFTEHLAAKHLIGGGDGFFFRIGDDDAFASGESVRFDDQRRAEMIERGVQFGGVRYLRVARGWNAMALHEGLGKALAGFQLSSGLCGSEDGPASATEFIDDAEHERQLGSDDGEVRMDLIGKGDDGVHALNFHGNADGVVGDASVAGCAVHLIYTRGLLELPDQSMFASAAAENQNLHDGTNRKGMNSCRECQTVVLPTVNQPRERR